MTTPQWPDWLDDVWAKSAGLGAGGQPETLAQHTWSVMEKLAATIRLRPTLPAQIGVPRLWHCLAWACWLHDFGKAAAGFQARLRDGPRWPHRHEVLSLAFLDWIAEGFDEEERRWVAAAIVSHHRDAEDIELAYGELVDPGDAMLTRLVAEINPAILSGLWRWLAECPATWLEDLGLAAVGVSHTTLLQQSAAVAAVYTDGAVSIRKWLRAYRKWLRTLGRSHERSLLVGTLALRGHIVSSDHMASAHAGELPESRLAEPEKLLARWRRTRDSLYDHQRQCLDVQGSAVLMAPTGSGKTEAALLWAVAQAEPGRPVPRLYYTLPYQASMNAMYDRLNDPTEGAFPGQVGLEHGRSTLAYYRRWSLEEDYSPEKAAQAARWSNNLARLNYYPVRVLSPYQILKAPYRLRGYEALLADCFGATFILDEVHAYDSARLALILATVKYLREQFGARFFVMSATLPGLLRQRLAEALGPYVTLTATPELYRRFRRHRLNLLDGELLDLAALDAIAAVARTGQAVLVCTNTVKRAQAAYEGLIRRLGPAVEALLLHSRFNGRDRLRKEDVVRQATGSRSSARRPIVLVATQVVEVSLDIDLDVIYTDPAPLEALLQRFGRVNRRCLKASAPACVFREPRDGQTIYAPQLVQAALAVLEAHDGELVDEARVSDWLNQIYDQPAIADMWNRNFQQAYREFCDNILPALRAFQSDRYLEEEFNKAFDSVEVLPYGSSSEFEAAKELNPLEASQLLVPLRWRQYQGLKNKGLARESDDGRLREVDARYSKEFGLDLSTTYSSTQWED